MTDLSEGLASGETEPHPLKTFVNVSSGRLEDDDKIILTTDSIFDIFSFDEIKKSSLRFPEEKFVQFLKTALGNELEQAAVLLVDMQKKTEPERPVIRRNDAAANAFSQSAFYKAPAQKNLAPKIQKEAESDAEREDRKKRSGGAGHIYIKEGFGEISRRGGAREFLSELGKKVVSKKENLQGSVRNSGRLLSEKFSNISMPKIKLPSKSAVPTAGYPVRDTPAKKWPALRIKNYARKYSQAAKNTFSRIPESFCDIARKFSRMRQNQASEKAKEIFGSIGEKSKKASAFVLPDFSKIRNLFSGMDRQQRIYAGLIVAAILIVPFLGLKINDYFEGKKAAPLPEPIAEVLIPLAEDKNVRRLESLELVHSGSSFTNIVNLNGKIFSISQSEIIDLESKESSSVPENFGETKLAAGMDDLNIIFLIDTENKLISFSPVPKKFQDNAIAVPENSEIAAIGTYLTYLYLFYSENNRIYRYPRATGGFGEASNWLRSDLDLSRVSGVAISENIFLADGNNILKMFRGNKEDFSPEESATEINPVRIYTRRNLAEIYILDKENSRIVKFDADGKIISQYYHSEISQAVDFTIDTENNTAYISTSTEIKSFQIN